MNAVIFDMDGVLIDSERVVLEGFRYAGKKTGVPNAERMAIVGLGLNYDAWIEKLRLEFGADAMRELEHFYAEEADHIGRTLRIQKGALNSILDYSLHSNLGVLKNLVQLSCAKAFLRENVAGNRTGEIAVTFSDLSFQTYNVSAETEKYAHGDLRFAEDLVVPNQRMQSSAADVASFVDTYDFVESRLSGEQEQHHDAGNLQQNLDELKDQIMEAYFRQMSHLFQTSGLDLPALREKYAEQTPEKVILSTCITGIGSARSIQEILQKRLAYIPRLHVVAVSALDSMEKLAEKYGSSLRLVVGTVEPNIPGVLFITADRVFSREGILAIASIVDDWGMDAGQTITGQAEVFCFMLSLPQTLE